MSKIGVFMLYFIPNRHLKVCRKILWFPCFPCFSWPRKLEKNNENKKNKKARKCHTLPGCRIFNVEPLDNDRHIRNE